MFEKFWKRIRKLFKLETKEEWLEDNGYIVKDGHIYYDGICVGKVFKEGDKK